MKRLLLAALVLLIVAPARAGEPAYVSVTAVEWHFLPSRGSVKTGRVSIELSNGGQDAHNLRLRRLGGSGPVRTIGRVQPGDRRTVTFRLAPGRYRLWCSLRGHDKKGMHTLLRVR